MKNVSGNFLDDDELDGVVGGYDSTAALIPDSSGQSMQQLYLSSRDDKSSVVVRKDSSDDTLVARAKEFCESAQGSYGTSGQDSASWSNLVATAKMYSQSS